VVDGQGMKLRPPWAAIAVAAGDALPTLAFWGDGAVGSVWLLQALPGCS
jgi:hypothetical protein